MLYGRRKRLEQVAAREAAGESFWTIEFSKPARTKIFHAAEDAVDPFFIGAFYGFAHGLVLRDEGKQWLFRQNLEPRSDLLNYLMTASDDEIPMLIEALSLAFANPRLKSESGAWNADAHFDGSVNVVLREHRISFELIDHRMVPFESRELHAEVVAPVLTLLAGKVGWEGVEASYQEALSELSKGKPDDAITDAGTALQGALSALGCVGNALGPLIKSAKSKGLLAPHDSPLLDAIEKTLHWVSADRSETGDAHVQSHASNEDGWFTVHVVGAIILRLSAQKGRL